MRRIAIAAAAVLFVHFCLAQKKQLTIEQAFFGASSGINKPLPTVTWIDDTYYTVRYGDKSTEPGEVFMHAKTGKAVKRPNTQPVVVRDIKAFIRDTDLFYSDAGVEVQLTSSPEVEVNPTLSPDNKWVAFTRNNNLFAVEVASKKEVQLTSDGSDVILNGYASWVYYEEILGRRSRYRAFWWSPDSRHLAYMRFDDSEVPVFPIYRAEGQYGELEKERYPKAGDKNPTVRIGITSVEKPTTLWADFNEKDDQYFGTPMWTPAGQLWVSWMNRGQDHLKIYAIDQSTGQKKEIYEERQPTWIDLDDPERIEFLPSGTGFILKSDKDGWENLYLHDMNGRLINQITSGNFWGTQIEKIDDKNKKLYIRARKENSARFDFYRINFDGKGLKRLSFGEYNHEDINLSPNARYFVTTYSNLQTPKAMAIVDGEGNLVREIANSKGEKFDEYAIPRSELRRVKSEDGLFDLPVFITYPINFDSTRRYPVLISVYGGPNAGTVYDRWVPPGGSAHWFAQEGMIQVSIDNRSSGHFGKKGLNFIYRQLGKWEIEDYMAGTRWLRSQSWVDTGRVAITGGSFGGYMTCMALTYGADVFTHGIANASVTDWRLYDTHYTERFMDTPQENPEGYKATSVMTYADRYKGLLRIVHGTTDDNVHMQNSIQLIDKLQELQKHFEVMVYPNERHGIGGSSRSKYMHNRNETYRFLYQNLLSKPLPPVFGATNERREF